MKIQSALSILFAFAIRLSAQLPQGAVAPDFQVQDIEGQSWHLYDLLDAGKIVVLEMGTTWCQPCWAYHNSDAIQDLYTAHGPEGDNKVQVFFVECDPFNNSDCLFGQPGCNGLSPGNWIDGTTYPYLDATAIADSLQIAFYPTVYVICPNKKAWQAGQLDADALWEIASGCPVASGANNAGIFYYDAGTDLREVCGQLQVQPSFSLINLGSNALTAATVTLQWNNGQEQVRQWTGNLPLYGEALISFDSLPLDGAGMLKTTLSEVNGMSGDEDFSNNVYNDPFSDATIFSNQQIILKIRTDDYGAETYWELRDEQGNKLQSGGNSNVGPSGGGTYGNTLPGPGSYGSNMLITKTLTLPGDGCYSLLFVDAYGDGMCCDYGNGYYKLYNGNNPAVPIMTGGEFGASEERGFEVKTSTATGDLTSPDPYVRLYPNPAGEWLVIENPAGSPLVLAAAVHNTLGQAVLRLPAPDSTVDGQQWRIQVAGWAPGTYFLLFQTEDGHSAALPFSVGR